MEAQKEELKLPQLVPSVPTAGFSLQISMDNLKEMAEQRELFERFVRIQLKDTIDFGTLPNTDKPSLWKPGAEKIANIFHLGSRIVADKKEINIKDNYAIISYLIEIFHIPSGKSIAQCEGICSSLEKKYKERKKYEWIQGKKVDKGIEQTPVGDVLNTLAKMAQKRAYVGAVIIATKASDFFNHDLNEDEETYYENAPPVVDHKYIAPESKPVSTEKAMGGEYAEFKGGGFAPAKPVDDERTALTTEINNCRKNLGWTPPQMGKFIMDNTGKEGAQLSNGEMQTLVQTLKKIGVKK